MSKYLARVQLMGSPSGDEYQDLHDRMQAKGWSREIKSGKGTKYKLPHATYRKETTASDTSAQCDEVIAVADKVKARPFPQILVVRYDEASFRLSGV